MYEKKGGTKGTRGTVNYQVRFVSFIQLGRWYVTLKILKCWLESWHHHLCHLFNLLCVHLWQYGRKTQAFFFGFIYSPKYTDIFDIQALIDVQVIWWQMIINISKSEKKNWLFVFDLKEKVKTWYAIRRRNCNSKPTTSNIFWVW